MLIHTITICLRISASSQIIFYEGMKLYGARKNLFKQQGKTILRSPTLI